PVPKKPPVKAVKPAPKTLAKKPDAKSKQLALPIDKAKKTPVLFQKKEVYEAKATPPAPKPEAKATKKAAPLDLKLDEAKPEEDKTEAPIIETAAEAIKKMIKKGK